MVYPLHNLAFGPGLEFWVPIGRGVPSDWSESEEFFPASRPPAAVLSKEKNIPADATDFENSIL
jgi:hypothetical protein